VIELFTSNTPNGKKISIMLEEIKCDYKVTLVDISKDEQFKSEFSKISPFNKIPVITDRKNNISLFESGAILIYLGEQSKKFYDQDKKTIINQWLMAQMAYVGPMLGQHHQFHHYNPGKSKFGEERYFKVCARIYKELDERLRDEEYLAGNFYSIADIAAFPWIARHEWHDIGLKKHKNLTRWYEVISKRKAVQKGYDLFEKGEKIPSV
jgi:GST-like protein